jgi:hypothetical protein
MTDNNTEILEGNKLIAKFMDIQVTEITWKGWTHLILGDENAAMDYGNITYYKPDADWNQLMLVLERIEAKGHRWEIGMGSTLPYHYCRIWAAGSYSGDSPIDAVWGAVIEFIKWYNTTL